MCQMTEFSIFGLECVKCTRTFNSVWFTNCFNTVNHTKTFICTKTVNSTEIINCTKLLVILKLLVVLKLLTELDY